MDEPKPEDKPELPSFDPDFAPQSEYNRRAADARCLHYDKRIRYFVDAENARARDRFGQPL